MGGFSERDPFWAEGVACGVRAGICVISLTHPDTLRTV